jgi:hypothetical protein
MDWNTLAAAFIGGIFGGGLGGMIAYMQLRSDQAQALRARQWADAEFIADATRLLSDLQPRLCAVHRPADEPDYWADLRDRSLRVEKQLTRLAAGHPSVKVQQAADALSVALTETRHADRDAAEKKSPWHAQRYMLAERRWQTASDRIKELTEVVKDAAAPERHVIFGRRQKAASGQPAI